MPIHPKTKQYVTWKEFFKQWKQGMQQVTPLQQTGIIMLGQVIALIGILWGVVFTLKLHQWWLAVILAGGIVVWVAQFLGNYQKRVILQHVEAQYKLAQEELDGR